MIQSREISKISNKAGVRPQQIEKDYVITWVLWGISQNTLLKENLIFKGGTCLKKIHIADYRFSEDMDFTLKNDDISDEEIYENLSEVFGLIFRETRMRIRIDETSKEIHVASESIKCYVDYVGPLGGNGDHVKLDITRGEQLEFDPIRGLVIQNYSDIEGDIAIQSYCLEEVVIEKMAALMGRTEPRDLYDFDYLTAIEEIDLKDVYYEFERKAIHKGLVPAEFIEKVSGKEFILQRFWNERLQHQIKDLSKFKDIWRSVGKQFRKVGKIR
ncbi:MAG: nucleotidyl transferase AbiEii/AbiGii toxin family protein [Cyclobacteriaceae bacterium]|nr:nucleotidyl transferase AbiEii/AbiGii toxin family protein [Cyclobacteriaceae bacterium HetDA_MAG_MS6]